MSPRYTRAINLHTTRHDNEIQQVPYDTQQNIDTEGRRGVARVASNEKVEGQAVIIMSGREC